MYTFIVNPHSKSGLGYRIWEIIDPILKERNIKYQAFFTEYRRHATEIVRAITSQEGQHTLVILGGDGTINEVVNGIADLSTVTLGYIPIGSSNDFARGFGLSTDPLIALNHILTPSKYYQMNIGNTTYHETTKRFAVSSGIGFDAEVCHQVVISRLKRLLNKIGLGKFSYVCVALQRMLLLKPENMTLLLDNQKHMNFKGVYFVAAMNHRFEGGGFNFCPKADPCDDILNLIVIADMPKIKALLLLPTAFKGWHVRFKGVYQLTCTTADILSERALPVHTDGEPVFLQKRLHFELEKKKIRIIAS